MITCWKFKSRPCHDDSVRLGNVGNVSGVSLSFHRCSNAESFSSSKIALEKPAMFLLLSASGSKNLIKLEIILSFEFVRCQPQNVPRFLLFLLSRFRRF
jgi:hypothetical protein